MNSLPSTAEACGHPFQLSCFFCLPSCMFCTAHFQDSSHVRFHLPCRRMMACRSSTIFHYLSYYSRLMGFCHRHVSLCTLLSHCFFLFGASHRSMIPCFFLLRSSHPRCFVPCRPSTVFHYLSHHPRLTGLFCRSFPLYTVLSSCLFLFGPSHRQLQLPCLELRSSRKGSISVISVAETRVLFKVVRRTSRSMSLSDIIEFVLLVSRWLPASPIFVERFVSTGRSALKI